MEPEVIQVITEALDEAWGNPSSNYMAGVFKPKPKLYVTDYYNKRVDFVFFLVFLLTIGTLLGVFF